MYLDTTTEDGDSSSRKYTWPTICSPRKLNSVKFYFTAEILRNSFGFVFTDSYVSFRILIKSLEKIKAIIICIF